MRNSRVTEGLTGVDLVASTESFLHKTSYHVLYRKGCNRLCCRDSDLDRLLSIGYKFQHCYNCGVKYDYPYRVPKKKSVERRFSAQDFIAYLDEVAKQNT